MTESLLQGDDNHFDDKKNWLEELVGEDKKFKSLDDLAKGKAFSDHYISTLEQQRDELREDYLKLREEHNAGLKLQELIDKFDKQLSTSRNDTDDSNEDESPALTKTFDPKDLESLVSSKIQQAEASRIEQDNYRKVQEKVVERFGENFKSALKKQAISLGLNNAEVDAMARRNPSLFFKTFDLDKPASTEKFQTPPTSSTRNDSFSPSQGVQPRKKSYYEKLRKEKPEEWLNPKTLIQMDRDVQALGWDIFNDI